MRNITLLLYALLCTIEIVAEYFEISALRYATKPLLMPVLAVFFYISVKNNFNSFSKKIIAALLFSWAGDVFLMFPEYFLPGLVSFLIAHVFYILAFYENLKGSKPNYPLALPFILYTLALSIFMLPHLDEMLIPVVIYSFVITVMGVFAVLRKGNVNRKSFIYVLSGAALFILSDSTIALNKFVYDGGLPFARVIIMLTYLLAQYLIVAGALYHLEQKQN